MCSFVQPTITVMLKFLITPPPVAGRGIVFGRFLSFFLSLFLCQQHYEKTAGPICMEFSGKVWSDMGRPDYILGQFRYTGLRVKGQFVCYQNYCQWNWTSRLHSLGGITFCPWRLAQRTGVNKSVSFARWQQGAGFVVPRTTACLFVNLVSFFVVYPV